VVTHHAAIEAEINGQPRSLRFASTPRQKRRRAGNSSRGSRRRRVVALAVWSTLLPAAGQPLRQPKVGQCPRDYRESGGYRAPTR